MGGEPQTQPSMDPQPPPVRQLRVFAPGEDGSLAKDCPIDPEVTRTPWPTKPSPCSSLSDELLRCGVYSPHPASAARLRRPCSRSLRSPRTTSQMHSPLPGGIQKSPRKSQLQSANLSKPDQLMKRSLRSAGHKAPP